MNNTKTAAQVLDIMARRELIARADEYRTRARRAKNTERKLALEIMARELLEFAGCEA